MALDNNIDELQIEITTESNDAIKNLDKLAEKLGKLERASSSGAGLNNITTALGGLNTRIKQIVGIFASHKVTQAMGSWFKESADYVEALNLFEVSMGKASSAALKYAETVQDLMGIDVQDWVEAQGSFNQLLEGYGIADAKAAQMSKQLTQLGYDLSSLWNVDVDTAMKRLQSGMSGQIKGLKTWGINLSVASLRETALAHGIELSTAKMTEGQKAMLRYITLMEKTTNVQGDLARTLITPSNAMRIFEQQVTQLRRALGDIVSVVVARFIPVFQAVVQVVTKAAKAVAAFFGYELPEIDYSGIETGASAADDMADGLSSAASSAKKLKQYTMGFDELNVIDPNKGSSGGSTPTGGGLSNDFGFDPSKYEYDFLGNISKDTEELEKKLEKVFAIVGSIGAAFAAWKIGSSMITTFSAISTAIAKLIASSPTQVLSKICGAVAGVAMQFSVAGGGVKGFLSALGLIAEAAAPALLVLTVIISTIKVLIERWNDIKATIADSFEKLQVGERLEALSGKLDQLGEKLGWVNGFWEGLKSTIGGLMDLIGGTVVTVLGGTLVGLFNGLVSVISGVVTAITGVVDVFRGLGQFLTGVFTLDMETLKQSFSSIGTGIWEIFSGLVTGIMEGLIDFIGGIIVGVSDMGATLLGELIPNIVNGIVTFFSNDLLNGIKNALTLVAAVIVTGLGLIIQEGTKFIASLTSGLLTPFKGIFDKMGERWTEWKDFMSEAWDNFTNSYGTAWHNFWNGLANFFISIWNGILEGLEKAINFCIDGLNALIDKVNAMSGLLGITFSHVSRVTIERVPLMEIRQYAMGGLPDYGELFMAREAGPELVGQIGRQTAVANNDQIVSGITNGVKEGNGDLISAIFTVASQLVQAMEDNRTDVIIGDDDIGRANDRYEQSRGVRVNSGSFANAY